MEETEKRHRVIRQWLTKLDIQIYKFSNLFSLSPWSFLMMGFSQINGTQEQASLKDIGVSTFFLQHCTVASWLVATLRTLNNAFKIQEDNKDFQEQFVFDKTISQPQEQALMDNPSNQHQQPTLAANLRSQSQRPTLAANPSRQPQQPTLAANLSGQLQQPILAANPNGQPNGQPQRPINQQY